ncbi:hypothetical protein ACHAXS_012027, partial [Conticribra weissflogii]
MTSRGVLRRCSVAILLLFSILPASNAICSVDGDDSPINCMNGLWNEDICECECIPPFCPDINGQCAATWVCSPTNPWSNCVRGVDCPWWKNPLKANSCATGPEVPPGIWQIYGTEEDCCAIYSQAGSCGQREVSTRPTPFPTIGIGSLPDTEVISVRFSGLDIPNGVSIVEFQNRLRDIIKIFVLDLAEQYKSLKILNLEYRQSDSLKDDLVFDITVPREAGVTYGSIIHEALKDRISFIYNDILEWLRLQNVDEDDFVNSDFCFVWQGQSYCSTRAPTRQPTPEPTQEPTEVIPIRFFDIELPIDVSIEAFKDQMRNVVKRIVMDLAEKYNSLRIIDVQLRDRRRTSQVELNSGVDGDTIGKETEARHRVLQRIPFDLVYDVVIVKESGVDFNDIILDALHDRTDEIIESINDWVRNDQGVINDRTFAFCLESSDGRACISETRRPTYRPTSRPSNQATETIAIEFTDVTLPISVNLARFREEMRVQLIDILNDLSDRYSALDVIDVSYRRDRRRLTTVAGENDARKLQRVFDLTYDVTILRQDGIDFRSIILNAIRSSDEEILKRVVDWMVDEGIDDEDLTFEFCLNSDCFTQATPTSSNGVRETISVEFTDVTLPPSVSVVDFREKLRILLNTILDDLADRYEALTILSVRYSDDRRATMVKHEGDYRKLQRVLDLAYDVTVHHSGDIDFRSIIMDAVRTSDEFILQGILEWMMEQDIGEDEDVRFEFCLGSDCFSQEAPPSSNVVTEVISIEFNDVGIPRSVSVVSFREELRLLLKGIFEGVADRYESMTIIDVVHRDDRQASAVGLNDQDRNLQQLFDLSYDVTILHEGGTDFTRIFVDAILSNNEVILQGITKWIMEQDLDEYDETSFEFCLGSECFFSEMKPSSPSVPQEFYYEEVVPIRFSVRNLPTTIKDQKKLRQELKNVLTRVLLYLSDRNDFSLLKVEYRDVVRIQAREIHVSSGGQRFRGMQSDANTFASGLDRRFHHMMFDVTIAHKGDIDLAALIRRNYDIIIQEIRQNSQDFEAVTDDFEFEVCEESDTCFTDGRDEITYTFNTDISTKSLESQEESVSIWVIVLIVIAALFLCFMCCICIAFCVRSRQQNEVEEEVVNHKVQVKSRSTTESLTEKSSTDSDSSDASSDANARSHHKMTPQSTMAIKPYVSRKHQPQYPQLPPHQSHPFPPVIQNNYPNQGSPVLALINQPHSQSSDSTASYNTASDNHDDDYSSAQYDESLADLSRARCDPSIGGIDDPTYDDYDSIMRPDPSMYSLFTTRSSRIRKSRKSDCSSKRTPLEPSVCTQKTTEYKKRDPSLYLQYEGTEAPGFKSGDSIYFQDDRSVQCGTAQLLLADVEEEMSGIYSNYSEQYDASTVHYGTRDPSAHEDYSNMRSRQSYEHFNFPDPNEVMSMMSGFSRGVHDGDTADSQVTYSV